MDLWPTVMSRDLRVEMFWLVVCVALLVGAFATVFLFLRPRGFAIYTQVAVLLPTLPIAVVMLRTLKNMWRLRG